MICKKLIWNWNERLEWKENCLFYILFDTNSFRHNIITLIFLFIYIIFHKHFFTPSYSNVQVYKFHVNLLFEREIK